MAGIGFAQRFEVSEENLMPGWDASGKFLDRISGKAGVALNK